MLCGIRCGVVEGHRGYPAGAESSWFGGAEQEQERYADEGYRAPDPRDPRGPGFRGGRPVGPRSGQALPPLAGDPPAHQLGGPGLVDDPSPYPESGHHLEAIERPSRRGQSAAQVGEGVYRTRRPVIAVPLGFAAALLAIPTLRLLLASAFGSVIVPSGVVAGVMTLIGLPLLAMGLYGLFTGAARVSDPTGVRAWLRPPLAYLVIGLVCCVAAGLAAA